MELVEGTSVAFCEKNLVEIYKFTFLALSTAGYKAERVPVSINRMRSKSEYYFCWEVVIGYLGFWF